MNKKGDLRIPSNRELIFIVMGFLVLAVIGTFLYNIFPRKMKQMAKYKQTEIGMIPEDLVK